MKCCLCGKEISRNEANNAEPLKSGYCCNSCNWKVIKYRLGLISQKEKKAEEGQQTLVPKERRSPAGRKYWFPFNKTTGKWTTEAQFTGQRYKTSLECQQAIRRGSVPQAATEGVDLKPVGLNEKITKFTEFLIYYGLDPNWVKEIINDDNFLNKIRDELDLDDKRVFDDYYSELTSKKTDSFIKAKIRKEALMIMETPKYKEYLNDLSDDYGTPAEECYGSVPQAATESIAVVGTEIPPSTINPMEDFEKYAREFEEKFGQGATPQRKGVAENKTKIKDGGVVGEVSSMEKPQKPEKFNPLKEQEEVIKETSKSATEGEVTMNGGNDFFTFVKMAQQIGLNNLDELEEFLRREKKEGETPFDTLLRYRASLGNDFKLNPGE